MQIAPSYQPLTGLQPQLSPALLLVFFAGDIVVNPAGEFWWRDTQWFDTATALVTGYLHGETVGFIDIPTLPDGVKTVSVRRLFLDGDPDLYACISHGLQILTARKEHAFCGACGHAMAARAGEWSMLCPQCQYCAYPRISPCIIVLVTRGDEMLLVRHHRHGKDSTMHTLVAGFIEPGESAEMAVRREVLEETGLTVGTLQYQFSQSWPFPHALMFGFHAEYRSGEIALQEDELCFGDWFHRKNPPELPPKFTIARKLVDIFL